MNLTVDITFEFPQCGHEREATEAERRKAEEAIEGVMQRVGVMSRVESLERRDPG